LTGKGLQLCSQTQFVVSHIYRVLPMSVKILIMSLPMSLIFIGFSNTLKFVKYEYTVF